MTPGFISAPPKPIYQIVYHAFGHINDEKTSVWLFEDHTLRVYRNDPQTGKVVNTDHIVDTAVMAPNAAIFETDDGKAIDFIRSDDCCGWGAIQAAGPVPGVTRYTTKFVPTADWVVRA